MQIQSPLSDNDRALWSSYVLAASAYWNARRDLLTNCTSLLEIVREGLYPPGERGFAIELATLLTEEDRKQLFPDLLSLASSFNNVLREAQNLILSLPRDWVLANIEETAEPLLHDGTYQEYGTLLFIYKQLDPALAMKLARRAAENPDDDIKEIGVDFLEERNSTSKS